jgi:hypothetical protein
MAQDQSMAEMDAVHKKNSVQVAAQVAVNTAKAALVPPNVGRSEPGSNPNFMQGTANGIKPNAFMLNRA